MKNKEALKRGIVEERLQQRGSLFVALGFSFACEGNASSQQASAHTCVVDVWILSFQAGAASGAGPRHRGCQQSICQHHATDFLASLSIEQWSEIDGW